MQANKISYRIFILTVIFILICLLYVVRLTGIVLTGEKVSEPDEFFEAALKRSNEKMMERRKK